MAQLPRSTDTGTVILHVALIAAFGVLTATGLRIATDDPEAQWLLVLDPLLPVENLWLHHLEAGVGLAGVLAAYAVYMRQSRLTSRVRLDRSRLVTLLRPGRARFSAANVLVYWVLMGALAVEIWTGTLLFWGSGRWALDLHLEATFVCIGCVVVHVALHAAYGGLAQLARIARPAPLVMAPPPPDLADMLAEQLAQRQAAAPPNRSTGQGEPGSVAEPASLGRPVTLEANLLATGIGVAMLAMGVLVGGEQMTRPVLRIAEIQEGSAPVLDGDLSDPVWARAEPVSVLTTQGGDFGGTHQSLVEIRAVHDADYVYFAFVWEDPTRSLKHQPLVKGRQGWEVAASREDLADEQRYNEDKFAVLLTRPGLPLIGAAIHLARLPLSDRPASSTERGLHYTDGPIADVWQWRASHGGAFGHVDNCHFAGPGSSPPDGRSQTYSGGFARDHSEQPYAANVMARPGSKTGAVVPRRLPRNMASVTAAMGRISEEQGDSESQGARWWMGMAESEPWSEERDKTVPVGTVVPGVVMADQMPPARDMIRGVARWAAGRWTLEVARRMNTGSALDVPIKSGVLLWVAAFDHAEKRHTRHLRPFRLEVE